MLSFKLHFSRMSTINGLTCLLGPQINQIALSYLYRIMSLGGCAARNIYQSLDRETRVTLTSVSLNASPALFTGTML